MKVLDLGDVFLGKSGECVVEKVEHHPSTPYQGQGDSGCDSDSLPYWNVKARVLNPDGSYNKDGILEELQLVSYEYSDTPSEQPAVLRTMSLRFI